MATAIWLNCSSSFKWVLALFGMFLECCLWQPESVSVNNQWCPLTKVHSRVLTQTMVSFRWEPKQCQAAERKHWWQWDNWSAHMMPPVPCNSGSAQQLCFENVVYPKSSSVVQRAHQCMWALAGWRGMVNFCNHKNELNHGPSPPIWIRNLTHPRKQANGKGTVVKFLPMTWLLGDVESSSQCMFWVKKHGCAISLVNCIFGKTLLSSIVIWLPWHCNKILLSLLRLCPCTNKHATSKKSLLSWSFCLKIVCKKRQWHLWFLVVFDSVVIPMLNFLTFCKPVHDFVPQLCVWTRPTHSWHAFCICVPVIVEFWLKTPSMQDQT